MVTEVLPITIHCGSLHRGELRIWDHSQRIVLVVKPKEDTTSLIPAHCQVPFRHRWEIEPHDGPMLSRYHLDGQVAIPGPIGE